jgi:imidazolonepropionase
LAPTLKGKAREVADILIVNAEEMLTIAGSSQKPRIGKQLRELEIIDDGALAIREGRIVGVGKTHEITKAFRGNYVLSAKGKTILPGFVDPHTHLVFAGSREDEFETYADGTSYLEILNGSEAILKTARETRRARIEKLVDLGIERLDTMLAHGTTTIEAKSGYGLNTDEEMKILEATKRINQMHCMNMVSTFSANAVPIEYKKNVDEYVDLIIQQTMPKVARSGLAEFCDVFCDRGMFTLEQAKRILKCGKRLGLKQKIHADHLSMLGGAEFAADIGATSADHLNYASIEGIKAMAQRGIVGVLLPAATFSLRINRYPDARLMIDSGVPIALGTDFNAGNWMLNMQLAIAMACHFMHMTSAEAITAATINSAHAICRGNEVGSLEVGKRADVAILNVPNHKYLGYSFGTNLVEKVIAGGRIVVDREKQDEPVFSCKTD